MKDIPGTILNFAKVLRRMKFISLCARYTFICKCCITESPKLVSLSRSNYERKTWVTSLEVVITIGYGDSFLHKVL